ncbi:YigZ family protein [Dielma fastidiosa]|uniref:Putative YigZ family protein n=1 Tax=Dielma fastidiosa TaxID=1034346 RepID=A0A318KT31_9FIRM|nr:YigZ family protein [Dielma fastidiosa]PXX80981.1 putative YigZ family protein [Dielma fastidiosa]
MPRLKEEFMNEFEIEKSRFICYLNRAFNEEEAKAYILRIKKLHPNATHHCSAFLIGEHSELQRSNDDGEPSGTAGVPMLESLRMNKMNDIVAVVVRYFGGIKLGAGGLIRAYSKSVSEAIKLAPLTDKVLTYKYSLTFSYDLIGKLDYFLAHHDTEILNKVYDERVTYVYRSRSDDLNDAIQEIASGSAEIIFLGEEIVEQEIIK